MSRPLIIPRPRFELCMFESATVSMKPFLDQGFWTNFKPPPATIWPQIRYIGNLVIPNFNLVYLYKIWIWNGYTITFLSPGKNPSFQQNSSPRTTEATTYLYGEDKEIIRWVWWNILDVVNISVKNQIYFVNFISTIIVKCDEIFCLAMEYFIFND